MGQVVLLCALLVLIGIALTMSMAPLMSEVAYCGLEIDEKYPPAPGSRKRNSFAQAFGISACAFSGGCVIGPIWGGFMLNHFGWGTMVWTISLLSVAAAAATCVFLNNEIREEE